jgi:hypothetical protein
VCVHGDDQRHGWLTAMRMICERPVDVEDRVQAEHWEGDLIMGPGNRTAIGTLVERTTRFVVLLRLPAGVSTAQTVQHAVSTALMTLRAGPHRTLTWDQGKELAHHQQITVNTGASVFFCDAHSPWQRGSNENMNGLLRDYFPKGTDLGHVTPEQPAPRRPARRIAAPTTHREPHPTRTREVERPRAPDSLTGTTGGLATSEPAADALEPRLCTCAPIMAARVTLSASARFP